MLLGRFGWLLQTPYWLDTLLLFYPLCDLLSCCTNKLSKTYNVPAWVFIVKTTIHFTSVPILLVYIMAILWDCYVLEYNIVVMQTHHMIMLWLSTSIYGVLISSLLLHPKRLLLYKRKNERAWRTHPKKWTTKEVTILYYLASCPLLCIAWFFFSFEKDHTKHAPNFWQRFFFLYILYLTVQFLP